jgi:hypothetical protein
MAWDFSPFRQPAPITLLHLRTPKIQLWSRWSKERFQDLLISELARILPVQWEWLAQPHGLKSYVVPFPSKAELDRMVAIRAFTTRNREGTLIFEEFDVDVQPIKVLDQVWVTVTNVPKALRAYLLLWAMGSCIGNTQKVDMVYLKQTGVILIQVAVIDASKIPEHVDVCVDRGIYRIYFTVDKEESDDLFNPDEDDLLGDDTNNGMDGSDHVMEDAPPNPNRDGSLPASSNNQSMGDQNIGGYTPQQ